MRKSILFLCCCASIASDAQAQNTQVYDPVTVVSPGNQVTVTAPNLQAGQALPTMPQMNWGAMPPPPTPAEMASMESMNWTLPIETPISNEEIPVSAVNRMAVVPKTAVASSKKAVVNKKRAKA